MHVIDYLADPKCANKENTLLAEYRLLCSGNVYRNGKFIEWYKSEGAKILLNEPLLLFAATERFDDYPLELALQIAVPYETETETFELAVPAEMAETSQGHSRTASSPGGISYYPDEEVARDIAALLTLLCRRLVTVAGKVNQCIPDYKHPAFSDRPVPAPFATSLRKVFWPSRPATVLIRPPKDFDVGDNNLSAKPIFEIEHNNPSAKPVDASWLTGLLLGLPKVGLAKNIVASCRLYALALELIRDWPDISYQLFISCVETMANAALPDFQPTDDQKVQHKKTVYDVARQMRMSEAQARALAIEACRGEWWATKKFKRFIMDNVDDLIWAKEDDLFPELRFVALPKREEFAQTLARIYGARCKATHEGQPFPITASFTGGRMPIQAGFALHAVSAFPPVGWFERVVNCAIRGFWERAVGHKPQQTQPTTAAFIEEISDALPALSQGQKTQD